jgi:protein O-GlcNAc transferase
VCILHLSSWALTFSQSTLNALNISSIAKSKRYIPGRSTMTHAKTPSQQEIQAILGLYNSGNFHVAARLANDLAVVFPNHPFAWKVLGAVYAQTGQFDKALVPMQQGVRLDPHNFESHTQLGALLQALGRINDAIASCREAIRLKPDYAPAHNNLGNALKELGCFNDAEASYLEAIRLKSDYAQAYSNLGAVLREQGRFNDAEASYREAIQIKPDFFQAHSNLGNSLSDMGRFTEAEACYRDAIKLNPDSAQVHSNLGNVLKELGRLDDAEASCREAIRLSPDYAQAHSNLGNALKELGRFSDADASYREAIRLKSDFSQAYSNLLFSQNYVESLIPEAALIQAQSYGAIFSLKAKAKFSMPRADSQPVKLKIGFVSGDFRNHPVGYFTEGLLRHLDQSKFELHAFPTVPKQDDLTIRLKSLFRYWNPIFGKNDLDAASLIHSHNIQILFDLSGHTAHNRLPIFAYKPAPVQVSWLGYFATTGLPEIDYLLGDPHVTPSDEAHYFSERLWQMPETYLCFTPPVSGVSVGPLPALTNEYVTFGCFNSLTKIGRPVVSLWSKVLHSLPRAKLFLKTKLLADTKARDRIIHQFADLDIELDRLILEGPSSRAQLLAAYNKVDIALDPFPYPGGTTSTEALWMGVPVLTLKGDRFLSHVGETIAHNSGQSDWIAHDHDDYVRKAVDYAADLHQLNRLRLNLRNKVVQSPLFDSQRFAKHFEYALQQMWTSR